MSIVHAAGAGFATSVASVFGASGGAAAAGQDHTAIVVAVIGAIAAVVSGGFLAYVQRRGAKDVVTAGKAFEELQIALRGSALLTAKNEALERKLNSAERRANALEDRLDLLTVIIRENGIELP